MVVRLPSRVARVGALAVPDGGHPVVSGIVDPGGGDAHAVLAAVEARLAERGIRALRVTAGGWSATIRSVRSPSWSSRLAIRPTRRLSAARDRLIEALTTAGSPAAATTCSRG